MRYSYDYKRKAVDLYRQGLWPDTPDDLNEKDFRKMIRKWVRVEDACGPDALRHKNSNKVWTPEEKLKLPIKFIFLKKRNCSVYYFPFNPVKP